jgi:hypothetical protein
MSTHKFPYTALEQATSPSAAPCRPASRRHSQPTANKAACAHAPAGLLPHAVAAGRPPHIQRRRLRASSLTRPPREIRLHWLHNGKKRRKSWGFDATECFTGRCIALQNGCTALHSVARRFHDRHEEPTCHEKTVNTLSRYLAAYLPMQRGDPQLRAYFLPQPLPFPLQHQRAERR